MKTNFWVRALERIRPLHYCFQYWLLPGLLARHLIHHTEKRTSNSLTCHQSRRSQEQLLFLLRSRKTSYVKNLGFCYQTVSFRQRQLRSLDCRRRMKFRHNTRHYNHLLNHHSPILRFLGRTLLVLLNRNYLSLEASKMLLLMFGCSSFFLCVRCFSDYSIRVRALTECLRYICRSNSFYK